MSGLFDTPVMIVLEPPGPVAPGAHRYRCMICVQLHDISDLSYQTVRDCRRDKRGYVVCCYGCYSELRPALSANMTFASNAGAARSLLGYR